jgi:hypothetical protein
MNRITESEKTDRYLALSAILEMGSAIDPENGRITINIGAAEFGFGGLAGQIVERAEEINAFSREDRAIWFALWRERIKNRGRTGRLDENVHAEQIAEVLKNEPETIRLLIKSNLPDDIAHKVAVILQSPRLLSIIDKDNISAEMPQPDQELVEVIREKFLENFAVLEDIYDPVDLDGFSMRELGNFIWQLGLNELKIVAAGIDDGKVLKEFWNRFGIDIESSAASLSWHTEEPDEKRIEWAENACGLANNDSDDPETIVRLLGIVGLAAVFAFRGTAALRNTSQKLPVDLSLVLERYAGLLQDRKRNQAVFETGISASVAKSVSAFASDISKGAAG